MCDCDRYAEHLAELSVKRRMVVAAEDVRNQFGVLLARRGTPLGSFAFGKMRGHRLNRPVDEALAMRRCLDAPALTARLRELLASSPDLQQVHERSGIDAQLARLVECAADGPALLQKLSVLEEALPQVFHRALFTAWLAALLAMERGLPSEETGVLFRAGLLHDLGLLHISPALVDKKSGISADEWVLIQRHVLTGAIIADSLGQGSARVARVILQHHERADGSGYPAGRMAEDIDPLANILALCDMVHALRFASPFLGEATVCDCLPYLRVNRHLYGEENYLAAGRLLQLARDVPASAAPRRIPRQLLLDANHSLVTLRQLLERSRPLLGRLEEQRRPESLLVQLAQFERVSDACGLGRQDLCAALDRSIDAEPRDASLRELQATARELLWLVRRIERQLQTLGAAARSIGEHAALGDLTHDVQFELRRAWQRFEA